MKTEKQVSDLNSKILKKMADVAIAEYKKFGFQEAPLVCIGLAGSMSGIDVEEELLDKALFRDVSLSSAIVGQGTMENSLSMIIAVMTALKRMLPSDVWDKIKMMPFGVVPDLCHAFSNESTKGKVKEETEADQLAKSILNNESIPKEELDRLKEIAKKFEK